LFCINYKLEKMKIGALILFSLVASASAFTSPMLATRAVGKPVAKKVAVKKAPTKEIPKKVIAKKALPKKAPTKAITKKAPTNENQKKAPAKKAPALSFFAKKAPVSKAPASKVVAKKALPAKKVIAKKALPAKKVIAKKALPAKKVIAKSAPAKKVFSKRAPIVQIKAIPGVKGALRPKTQPSKGYVTFEGASKFKIKGISGGGNKAPSQKILPPDLSDPKLQIKRDPKFYAEAAKKRLTKSKTDFLYEDGLTVIERDQKKNLPTFLSGSARSQADASRNIVGEIEGVDYFGLSADRFQLLFITIFGLFFLVGFLSGTI